MADTPVSERTEKPSPKKLKDAREKGQVARSRDLAAAVSLLAVSIALSRLGPLLMARIAQFLIHDLGHFADRASGSLTIEDIGTRLWVGVAFFGLTVGPLLAVGGVTGVAANVAQSGWSMAPQALKLNWSKLGPSQGLARLAPKNSGIDLLKQAIAVTIVGLLAWSAGRSLLIDSPRLALTSPAEAATTGWSAITQLIWRCGLGLLVLSAADYGVQWWRHWSSLKMTKQEVRDESKAHEGAPEIKARVRKVQREMARGRMLQAVKDATVVIANPTHFAVALEYRRDRASAPVVVAKGADHMAQQIKKMARDHGVPIVENVSLAQALYKSAEVGDQIPGALFGAVAEVLAYLVRIKQLML
jgi:flagellar biosynthesis protein FlhB